MTDAELHRQRRFSLAGFCPHCHTKILTDFSNPDEKVYACASNLCDYAAVEKRPKGFIACTYWHPGRFVAATNTFEYDNDFLIL